uniref:Organic cation transporter protein-like n=1 Tax=Saccoglossus kowalevskii TaxID=10224 RepID=A0ABM0MVT6_SACKO|nr:PREDICTED: organic cation transporter protein-like [Saccoglossus kowalevskii]
MVLTFQTTSEKTLLTTEWKTSRRNYDDILEYIGEFGPYQKRCYYLLCLVVILPASHAFAHVFLAAETDYWCYVPELDKYKDECCLNNSMMFCQDLVKNLSIPLEENSNTCGRHFVYSHCERYVNKTNTNTTMKCNHGWEYDRSQYKSTIFQEFNLVCGRYYMGALSSSAYSCGMLIGSIGFGSLSDKIGRLPTLMISATFMAVSGTACAFSPNIHTYSFLRMFIGASQMGIFITTFVLATELVGPSTRVFVSTGIQFYFAFGYMLLTILAYFIKYWWILQLCISLPAAIFLLYWWIIPESPRWLISVGKYEKAVEIIGKFVKVDEVTIPEMAEHTRYLKHKDVGRFLDLFRLPNMRKKCLTLCYLWFTSFLLYYGLSLNTSSLGGNDYVNAFMSAAVEIPSTVLSLFLPETRLGRRWSLSSTLLLAGVALILTLFTPACKFQWIGTSLTIVGKFAASTACNIVYIFSAEIFPTPVRTIGIGISSMSARIACILVPQMILIKIVWEPLPIILFSASSISAGFLSLLLPETRHHKLPQTLEEGEIFGK